MNTTALIIGAAAIAAIFVVWKAAQPAAPVAPPQAPCGVPISAHGTTVTIPCAVFKAAGKEAATIAKAPVNVVRGVVTGIFGGGSGPGLFASAMAQGKSQGLVHA